MFSPKNFMTVILGIFFIYTASCHRHIAKGENIVNEPFSLIKRDIKLVLVAKHEENPSFIKYHKMDVYNFNQDRVNSPFMMELLSNPNMYNPNLTAKVFYKGKLLRQFNAKKSTTTVLSDNNTVWSSLHSKLLLAIPFIKKGETLEITTSYDWMNMRYLEPLLLQENGLLPHSQLTVDIPYGIMMSFKSSKDGLEYHFSPLSLDIESKFWQQEDNKSGSGQRYIWKASKEMLSISPIKSNQLQLFLSFNTTPTKAAGAQPFDSWQEVSSYLYERISGYEVASQAIKEHGKKLTSNVIDDEEKVKNIFTYLSKVNKKINVVSYLHQDVQPATLTYARNFGSPFDIVILGKSLLSSMGISADMIIAANKLFNPYLIDCFNPALFYSVILAATVGEKTIYFDPLSINVDQLSPSLQGQHALLLRPSDSTFFLLPFDKADANKTIFSYNLYMTDFGFLEGEYAFDIIGYDVSKWHNLEKKENLPNVSIESRIFQGYDAIFSFDHMQSENKPNEMRLNGAIKSLALSKNDNNDFILPLRKIIDPIISILSNHDQDELSRVLLISLFISLPEHLSPIDMPKNISLGARGLEGHFYFDYKENKIMIETQAIVQLPLSNEARLKMKTELDKLDLWQNSIIIRDNTVNSNSINNNDNTVVPNEVFLDEEEHKTHP